MKRLRFMQAEKNVKLRPRVPCYLLPPKLKLDKDRHRIVVMLFSVKMDANTALLCDERIQRAFEDCETLEREITEVRLRSTIENTDVEFFELPDAKQPIFKLSNLTLEALFCERDDGQTYLYLCSEVSLNTTGIGPFVLSRYGTQAFCEFVPSQFALEANV